MKFNDPWKVIEKWSKRIEKIKKIKSIFENHKNATRTKE